MKKKKSLIRLKKDLDYVFSRYIRQRDNHVCFTCDKQLEPEQSQCGHFVSRSYHKVRWNEENCNCQCMRCNVFLKGNYSEYAERLQKKYGMGIINKLNEMKRGLFKANREFYENKIIYYTNLLKNLL